MNKIFVGKPLAPDKRIVVTAASRTDVARRRDGEQVSAATLQHADAATQVQIGGGRFSFTVGEPLHVEGIDGEQADVKLIGIRLIEVDKMTAADFEAAGYRDRAEYMNDWGEIFGPRVWFFHIQHIIPESAG